MQIAILSRNRHLYSTRRLIEAAQGRGHQVRIIDPLKCVMDVTSRRPAVYYRGETLPRFDAVIPRIGASVTFYALAVLRQFEVMGVYPANESVAIGRSRDKLRSLQLLARAGVGMPDTAFAHSPDDTKTLVQLVGGAPLVLKLLQGTQGRGIVLAETNKAAESVIDAFRELDANFLVQQFIQEAGGADIRAFVIGNRVVAAMLRQAKEGEFRSNLHRGGSASIVKLSPQERATAIKAARTVGLNVAGVDIVRGKDGPLVLEVNSSPGLEGIENATGKDVAGMVIEFLEKEAGPNKTRTRGRG